MDSPNHLMVIQPQAAPTDDFMGPEFDLFHVFNNCKKNDKENIVMCTACSKDLSFDHPEQFRMHPKLKVIECKQCFDFYHTGQFIQDDDGMDEYCLWCGDGGNLIMCSYCNHSFCNRCIIRNFSSKICTTIKNKPDWPCFVCDDTQLLGKVRHCKKIMKKLSITESSATSHRKNDTSFSSLVEGNQQLDDLISPMESSIGKSRSETGVNGIVMNGSKKVTPITILREKERYVVQQKSISCDEQADVTRQPRTQSDPECRPNTTAKNKMTGKLLKKIADLQSKFHAAATTPEDSFPVASDKENIEEKGDSDADNRSVPQTLFSEKYEPRYKTMQCNEPSIAPTTSKHKGENAEKHIDVKVSPPLAKFGRNVGRRTKDSPGPSQTHSFAKVGENLFPQVEGDKQKSSSQVHSHDEVAGNCTPCKVSNSNEQVMKQKSCFSEKLKEADECLARLTEIFIDLADDKHAFGNAVSNHLSSPSQYSRFRATSTLLRKVKKALGKLDEMKNTLQTRKTHLGTFRDSDHADGILEKNFDSDVEKRGKNHKTKKHKSTSSSSPSSLSEYSVPEGKSGPAVHNSTFENDRTSASQPMIIQHEQLSSSQPTVAEHDQISASQPILINRTLKVLLKKLSEREILKFSQKSHVSDTNSISSDTALEKLDTDSSKNRLRSNQFGISDRSSTSTECETSSSYSGKPKKLKRTIKGDRKKIETNSEKIKKESEDSEYQMDEDDEYFSASDYGQSISDNLSQSDPDDNEIAMNMLLQKMQDESRDASDSDVENLITRSARMKKVKTENEKCDIESSDDKSLKASNSKSDQGYRHPLLRRKWRDESGSETTNGDEEESDLKKKIQGNKRTTEEILDAGPFKKPRRRLEMGEKADSDSNLTTDSDIDMPKPQKRNLLESTRLIIDSGSSDSAPSDSIIIKSNESENDDNIDFEDHILSTSDENKDDGDSNKLDEVRNQFPKKKRKRLVPSDSEDEVRIKEEPIDDESPLKRGRRNIRKILDDDEVSQSTQQASKEELQRINRLEKEREFEEEKEDVVIIDENSQTPIKKSITISLKLSKDPIVEVHQHLVKNLKPHQIEGVQFLWDNIVEKVKVANSKRGNGCILAHCMGLGKTLQTITFLHTVLMSKHLPKLRTALVLCPFGTINNWVAEFKKWLPKTSANNSENKFVRLHVTDLNSARNDQERISRLGHWQKYGGVLVIGYGLFRSILSNKRRQTRNSQTSFVDHLSSPGPDILVCDEGHILKNAISHIATIVQGVNTRRRIILTGTPLQNNMVEYHCMVSIVKPKLLGTLKEFKNRFMNPIENGQHVDSTDGDVKLMKKRAHVLHELLSGCVQRKDHTCLCAHLAPKYEYVLSVRLSDLQIRMYENYISMHSDIDAKLKKGCLFNDFKKLLLLVCHPRCLVMEKERKDNKENQDDARKLGGDAEENAKSEEEDDSSDDSIIFISDDELHSSQPPKPTTLEDIHALSGSKLRHFIQEKSGQKPSTRNRKKLVDIATKYLDINFCKTKEFEESLKLKSIQELKAMIAERGGSTTGCTEKTDLVNLIKSIMQQENQDNAEWFEKFMPAQQSLAYANVHGGKIVLMLEILQGSCKVGDKVVIFSQSLLTLDLIEEVLKAETKDVNAGLKENNGLYSKWYKNKDYYRLDGSTPGNLRDERIALFNNKKNARGRLFLISTRAGGIGINLVGANRAIVFDASWNPTHDIQSIFRLYRFGQTKPCYIYRFIAQGTMEEKIYERQIMKLSLAFRVIDEHQILRHFSAADISELYKFEPAPKPEKNKNDVPQCAPPCDALLADILKTKDCIVSYHEHDSLLNHQVSEELTDADRRAAWEEYDKEQNKLASASANTIALFQTLNLDVLRCLCSNADEILATIQGKLSQIKEKPFQQTMIEIQMTNRQLDVDSVASLATNYKLEQHIIFRRLTALRKIVMQYNAEAQKCYQIKRALGPSTSAVPPSGAPNRPFVPIPNQPINMPSRLSNARPPNRYHAYQAKTSSRFHHPQKGPDSNIRYNNSHRFHPPRQQTRGVPPRPRYSSAYSHTVNSAPRHTTQMPQRPRYTVPK